MLPEDEGLSFDLAHDMRKAGTEAGHYIHIMAMAGTEAGRYIQIMAMAGTEAGHNTHTTIRAGSGRAQRPAPTNRRVRRRRW
jgi:hypothetical protein